MNYAITAVRALATDDHRWLADWRPDAGGAGRRWRKINNHCHGGSHLIQPAPTLEATLLLLALGASPKLARK